MSTSKTEHFALFSSARGDCGVVWTSRGLVRVQLPEESPRATRARLEADFPEAVEAAGEGAVAGALEAITAHLGGEPRDFRAVPLDLDRITPFRRRISAALRQVEAGETVTYQELAARAGSDGAARAVGRAMATNPWPIVVPCHRVLSSGSRIGGFSAHGGAQTKVDLLALEGVTLPRAALGLGFEPAEAVAMVSQQDEVMAALIERAGPLRLLVDPLESPFEALIKAIVYQQLTGKAAATIVNRVADLFGGALPDAEALAETPEDELRTAGLSRAKASALRDLAAKTRAGIVPSLRALRAMSDQAVIDQLTVIRGVGRWTVEMLLIFRLGRPDVFPADDYGVRKGLAVLLGENEAVKPRRAVDVAERWKPYRTVASWYLWRAAELSSSAT